MTEEVFKYPAPSRWGVFTLTASKKGLKTISFPLRRGASGNQKLVARPERIPKNIFQIFLQTESWLKSYLQGKIPHSKRVPIDYSSYTVSQARMLKQLVRVPFGETRSYAWLARECGIPKGLRATGQLLKANPLPILFPCHRIIRKDGSLGGFSQGTVWKRKLIAHERVSAKKRFV